MASQFPYVYILEIRGQPPAIFTWPNIARKFIRDVYTAADGELHLPPEGRAILRRHKVNPKLGQAAIISAIDIEKFLRT